MVTKPIGEFMILRPTMAFTKFLNKLIAPNSKRLIITHDLLKIDATVYILPYFSDPTEAAAALEKRHKEIFKNELSRWLPVDKDILSKLSFFDFYVFFNFDYHNYILNLVETYMENNKLVLNPNNHVLVLKPRKQLKHWIQEAVQAENKVLDEKSIEVVENLSLDQIGENATAVVKDFNEKNQIIDFLKERAPDIFEFELNRMCPNPQIWPNDRDFHQLLEFYDIEIHTQLVDMLHA